MRSLFLVYFLFLLLPIANGHSKKGDNSLANPLVQPVDTTMRQKQVIEPLQLRRLRNFDVLFIIVDPQERKLDRSLRKMYKEALKYRATDTDDK